MSQKQLIERTSGEWESNVIIYTDGASRGNPGPASLGIFVTTEAGDDVYERAERLEDQTNNYAEYMAVLRALEVCSAQGVQKAHFRSDSQLLIRQMTGVYKVKNQNIKPLFLNCKKLESEFSEVIWEHVRREDNKKADSLANEALDLL